MFRKRSRYGSGKCDLVPSPACTVFGVLFEIDSSEEAALDQFEGLRDGYLKKACRVRVDEGRYMPAFTYYAHPDHVDEDLKPYTWYLKHVIIGAEEASLPEAYVQEVRATESIEDTNRQREKREGKLYEHGESAPWRRPEDAVEHPKLVNRDTPRIQGREVSVE